MSKYRFQQVKFNEGEADEKIIVVKERRISELKDIISEVTEELKDLQSVDVNQLYALAGDVISKNATKLFPEITTDDLLNAYPSEVEELVNAFVNVNFSGVKKVGTPLLGFIMTGLKTKNLKQN